MTSTIMIGDCRERLKELADASVDSVVCDPPYHLTNRTVDVKGCKDCGRTLGGSDGKPTVCPRCGGELHYQRSQGGKGFMGQAWDGGDVAFDPATWAETLRVLKPGGHLVAFSGTRTYHRMAVAIEDAGFEIRDQLAWVYGSGFPKSLDVSKAIDKAASMTREVIGPGRWAHVKTGGSAGVNTDFALGNGKSGYEITAPATPEAEQWQGWGTALKPSWEPICLARKSLIGAVAANVLAHGTGALNIDGCRIETDDSWSATRTTALGRMNDDNWQPKVTQAETHPQGRWPANLCHDGSEEVLAVFPDDLRARGNIGESKGGGGMYGHGNCSNGFGAGDSGSAARFFYCGKATTEERGEGNNHPTVKPVALMRWLVRLVTPKGGIVLDPFMGSGSTGLAAEAEQFHFIGCEMSPEYADIAERRIRNAAGMFADIRKEAA